MKLLCLLGIHRPLAGHQSLFVDGVSGKTVFEAYCSCGKTWMVDSLFGYFGFKVPIIREQAEENNL